MDRFRRNIDRLQVFKDSMEEAELVLVNDKPMYKDEYWIGLLEDKEKGEWCSVGLLFRSYGSFGRL